MSDSLTAEPIGRARGGRARAAALSAEERSAAARKAAAARWNDDMPRATHVGTLKVGDAEIDCAVLDDGRRVLSQRGVNRALGRTHGGAEFRRKLEGDSPGLPIFLGAKGLQTHISEELADAAKQPILYRVQKHLIGHGIDAALLPQICDVWIDAYEAGNLTKSQFKFAVQAKLLLRGLAHVGIIGLVDEATGYQKDRASNALAKILEAFIAKELHPWIKTFPAEMYEEMFRLRGMEFPRDTVQRPRYFGMLTNDIVYRRLAPGVLEELKRVTPKSESGRPRHKLFQKLTQNVGYPKLREHLGSLVTMMRLSTNWDDFMKKLDRIHPRYGDTIQLPFDETNNQGL